MGEEDFNLDEHLYNMAIGEAKARIDRSHFFICLVARGTHDNQSLLEQIEYAKQQKKPFYLLIEKDESDPLNLDGADVRCRQYFEGEKSLEEATKIIFDKAIEDSPEEFHGFKMEQAPDLNDIVKWPPKKPSKE